MTRSALSSKHRVKIKSPVSGSASKSTDFVLPSITESFGISALEAMACGIPVVVTETCGISDYVDGQSGLVVANDSHALSAGIMDLLSSPSAAKKYGMVGIKIATRLSWDEPVLDTEKMYESILRGSKIT